MRPAITLLPLCLLCIVAAAPQPDARYRAIVENQTVRAYGLDLRPGQKAPLYQNTHALLWIAVDDQRLSLTREEGDPLQWNLRQGDTRFLGSYTAKRLSNEGPESAHAVVVEIMRRDLVQDGCGCLATQEKAVCGCEPDLHLPELWAVALARMTLAGTRLEPGQAFAQAVERSDMLLVALTPVELDDLAGAESAIQLQPGDAVWIKAGLHQFKNLGTLPARLVTVEF